MIGWAARLKSLQRAKGVYTHDGIAHALSKTMYLGNQRFMCNPSIVMVWDFKRSVWDSLKHDNILT